MNYIEITIWNPFRKGNFTLMPRFEIWVHKDGFDFDWLFVSVQVSWYEVPEPHQCDGGEGTQDVSVSQLAKDYVNSMDLYSAIIALQEARRWLSVGFVDQAKTQVEWALGELQQIAERSKRRDAPPPLRYWQHDETGRTCVTVLQPSERWYEITKGQYEASNPSVNPDVSDKA